MQERYEVVRDMYHGFDYRTALGGTPQQRLVMMAGAIEWILDKQQQWAAAETTEEGKKKAQRRYQDTVLALSTAYALASATDEARAVREVGFPGHPRVLAKSATGSGVSSQERDLAIRQIVSRAVISTEIVDILKAAGIQSPDISILSDEFLPKCSRWRRRIWRWRLCASSSTMVFARVARAISCRPRHSPHGWRNLLRATTLTPSPRPRCCRS